MPKDITHLMLAKKVIENLPSNSLFHAPVKNNYNLFLAGSIIPDTPFYYIIGPHSRTVQKLAARLHTSDSNSLVPILDLLATVSKREPGGLAFAAGICSHILADTIFHPMIYYFSGVDGVHTEAQTRHRAFETALDYYFWPLSDNDSAGTSLHHIFNHLEVSQDCFARFYEKIFPVETPSQRKSLHFAIQSHMILQSLFKTSSAYKFICFLYDHKFGIRSSHKALFYPHSNPVALNFFKTTLRYYHPCQGTFFSTTIDELVRKTMTAVLGLLTILEKSMTQGNDIYQAIQHPELPDICPCFEDVGHKVKFWYGNKNIIKQIYDDIKVSEGQSILLK